MSFESFIMKFFCLGIMGVMVAFVGIVLIFWFTDDGRLVLRIMRNGINKI